MNVFPRCMLMGIAALGLGGPAYAACESALVLATYQSSSDIRSDWRLAELVDRGTWETINHDGGANAVIYGVPVGASYKDFKNAVEKFRHETRQSLSTSQLVTIATTGLDPNAPNAYRDCLNNSVFLADGLHAAIIASTTSDISILVKWFVPGRANDATVKWSPRSIDGTPVLRAIPQGLTTIRVARPKTQLSLSGSYRGYTTSAMILEPLPPAPAAPTVVAEPALAEKISRGQRFTIAFEAIPNGHVGTLYQYRSFDGVYTSGTRSWRVWGPGGPDGHFVDTSYCPAGCPGLSADPPRPSEHKLQIWGSTPPFTFDELGNVFYNGTKVGSISVH